MPRALDLARRDEALVASLISHRLPLADGVEAYRSFADRLPGWNKVVLIPDA
jgi:threonine dehydrogenase-like Zn-dependent dehydrogenase